MTFAGTRMTPSGPRMDTSRTVRVRVHRVCRNPIGLSLMNRRGGCAAHPRQPSRTFAPGRSLTTLSRSLGPSIAGRTAIQVFPRVGHRTVREVPFWDVWPTWHVACLRRANRGATTRSSGERPPALRTGDVASIPPASGGPTNGVEAAFRAVSASGSQRACKCTLGRSALGSGATAAIGSTQSGTTASNAAKAVARPSDRSMVHLRAANASCVFAVARDSACGRHCARSRFGMVCGVNGGDKIE